LSRLAHAKAGITPPVLISFKLAPLKALASINCLSSLIPWMDSSKPIGIADRFLSSMKSSIGKSAGINCSTKVSRAASSDSQKRIASARFRAQFASTETVSPSKSSQRTLTLWRSCSKESEPILIFQCLNPSSRNALASLNSLSSEPPSMRNKGIATGAVSSMAAFSPRKYRQSGIEASCVYRSNKAISKQDLADALEYKTRLNISAKRSGLPQSSPSDSSTKYLILASKLSNVSPVIRGATDASPQPCLPCSSVRQSKIVLASTMSSRDILIGSTRGMDRG